MKAKKFHYLTEQIVLELFDLDFNNIKAFILEQLLILIYLITHFN